MSARNQTDILKVSAKTNPASLAGAIAGQIRKCGFAEVQGIGAGAVNQLVKAVAIARGFFAPQGQDVSLFPSFFDTEIEGEERTVIRGEVRPTRL